MITFLRIEHRGGNRVAVFDRGHQQWRDIPGGGGRYDDGTFCLNEESLRDRIRNLESGGYDSSVEKRALEAMQQRVKESQ